MVRKLYLASLFIYIHMFDDVLWFLLMFIYVLIIKYWLFDMIVKLFYQVTLIHVDKHKGKHFPFENEMVYMKCLNLLEIGLKWGWNAL